VSIKRNTAINLSGALISVGVMLLTVPYMVHALGTERYGVMTIVWLLLGYFGFFDLGMAQATAFAVARSGAEERARIFWTGLAINGTLGLLGGLVFLLVAEPLFLSVFQLDPQSERETLRVLPLVALAIPLTTISSVFNGMLSGREMFMALNIRNIVNTMLLQLLPLAAIIRFGATLDVAITASLVGRALSVLFLAVIAFRAAAATLVPRVGDAQMFRQLASYGGWISAGVVLAPFITTLDRMVIGSLLSASLVAFYAVPFNLVSNGTMVTSALTQSLFPRLAGLPEAEAKQLAIRAGRTHLALMTVVCVGGVLILKPFLTLWIGREFAANAAVAGELLVLTVWLNAGASVAYGLIQARGRPKLTTTIQLAELGPFAGLLWLGASQLGIVGVAMARVTRSLADALLLLGNAGLLRPLLHEACVHLLLLAPAVALALTTEAFSLWRLVPGLALLALAAIRALAVSDDIRAMLDAALASTPFTKRLAARIRSRIVRGPE
jgi:O-antigen/teichoic acid export membrane protein